MVENNVMIGDFGIASEVKPGKLDVYQFCGTHGLNSILIIFS